MAIRFSAVSGFVLAAGLTFAPMAHAQNFFSFYEMSPRQIAGMLEDDGYELRGPMQRRGNVYVCDVVSVSGNPARLIVDARDGRVVERFAVRNPRLRDNESADDRRDPRPPRDVEGDDDEGTPHRQMALGDIFSPPSRVYGGDAPFSSKPDADEAPAPKPKRHAVKKHREPSVAKAPAVPSGAPIPDAATADQPVAPPSPSVAAVAPSAPPEPKGTDAVKPEAPPAAAAAAPETAPKKAEAQPTQKPAQPERAQKRAEPESVQKKAETDKVPATEPKPLSSPKSDQPRKKINDLPVGTLD